MGQDGILAVYHVLVQKFVQKLHKVHCEVNRPGDDSLHKNSIPESMIRNFFSGTFLCCIFPYGKFSRTAQKTVCHCAKTVHSTH